MNKKVLLVDDDTDLLRTSQVILEKNGFTVVTAANGKEGLEKLNAEKPDLAVLDVMMTTNLDGYNLLHTIKKDKTMKDFPIIMLTGMIDELGVNLVSGVEDEAMFPNVVFRNKPIEPSALVELIMGMIHK